MATQAGTILDAAIASALANDQGRNELASDREELRGVLSRILQQLYTVAALPTSENGWGRGAYFSRTLSVTLDALDATTPVDLPSPRPAVIRGVFFASTGQEVAVVSSVDVRRGLADGPPGVIIEDGQMRSAGRLEGATAGGWGDPGVGAVLDLEACYLPADLTADTDYVGATTPADATTTAWPDAHNQYLIDQMRYYLAIKDGARDPEELRSIQADLAAGAQTLGSVLRINAARLVKAFTDA